MSLKSIVAFFKGLNSRTHESTFGFGKKLFFPTLIFIFTSKKALLMTEILPYFLLLILDIILSANSFWY